MALLTDKDIRKLLGKDIVIEPFLEDGLTPVGYDFHIGEFVYSLEHGLLEPHNGFYILPPESTVQILTRESLWVSKRIAGLFHSKVSLVSRGLSHISTTLDPNWYGPLLITLRNNNKTPFNIGDNSTFVTLVMFKVVTPTQTPHKKPEYRRDILISQLNNQTQGYIDKVRNLIDNPTALNRFEESVNRANRSMSTKIADSMTKYFRRKLLRTLGTIVAYFFLILLISLQFYWEKINFIFNSIPYDSNILAVQIVAILSIVTLLLTSRSKSA